MRVESSGVESPIGPRPAFIDVRRMGAYWALTKPRVTFLVVMTTLAGFYLANSGQTDIILLLNTLIGTALIAGGTAGLNQCLESDADSRMRRTMLRPLPSGVLDQGSAFAFSLALAVAGAAYLALGANPLTAALGVLTALLYLLLYTPLKCHTPLCTAIGAVPGAIPPLMGFAAVNGVLDAQALTLFAILYFWQFPHFLAIALIYREDYERGGFKMLPSTDRDGSLTSFQIIAGSVCLIFVGLLPTWLELAGNFYLVGSILLGVVLLFQGIGVARTRTTAAARRLMRGTVIYLPLVLILMALDKL